MGKASGSTKRGLCPCGKNTRNVGVNKHGITVYGVLCVSCHKANTKDKKNYCQNCGFVALHSVQLDIDHKDGNKRNNNSDNLWTICSNCHRLKTHANKDWNKKYVQMS